MESAEQTEVVQLDYTFAADSGAFSRNGKHYWMISENELQLYRLPLGTRTASWRFLENNSDPILITCVVEVEIHNRSYLLVALRLPNGQGQLRVLDQESGATVRTILLKNYIPLTVATIPSSGALNSANEDETICFDNPVAIGTNRGQVIVMDLYYEPEMFKSNVEAEEVVTESYDSVNDRREVYNQPYVILHKDETGAEINSRNMFITCIQFAERRIDNQKQRLLFIGTNQGSMEIWNLELLQRMGRFSHASKKPVAAMALAVYSSSDSVLVTFGPLDKTRSSIAGIKSSISEVFLFLVKFADSTRAVLRSPGYSRALHRSQSDKRVKSSRILYSAMLSTGTNTSEKCLFIWQAGRSLSSEICMELLDLDRIVDLNLSEQDKRSWYTVFDVPASGSIVSAFVIPNSVEDFEQTRMQKHVEELYRFPPNNTVKQCYSVSFEMLVGAQGFISSVVYAGAPQQRLSFIEKNIHELMLSTEQLSRELARCKVTGLIQEISDSQMFDLFDLLLQQNMVKTICEHITNVSRLGPVTTWVTQKCVALQKHKLFASVQEGQIDITTSLHQTNAISATIHNLTIITYALFMETDRFEMKTDHELYENLLKAAQTLERNFQFVELWCWFSQHELMFIQSFTPVEAPESAKNIRSLCAEVGVPSYPPRDPRELLAVVWNATNPTKDSTQELSHKLQIIYYYLIDASVKAKGREIKENKIILGSFVCTFSQILTPSIQKKVEGYWLLDNISISHALGANAAKYLRFDKMALSLVKVAYTRLTAPGIMLEWPGDIFRQLLEIDVQFAEKFFFHTDFSIAQDERVAVLDLLLPKNLLLSLSFIRKQCKVTLEYDRLHFSELMRRLFSYCEKEKILSSLFLLPFHNDEEELLVRYLEENNEQEELRVLYYLQRSQFALAAKISDTSISQETFGSLVNNYKTVLPDVMFTLPAGNTFHKVQKVRADSDTSMEIDVEISGYESPPRVRRLLQTPKTEKVRSKLMQHNAFPAPTLEHNVSHKKQPFTPHVIPNTPASRVRMVHGSSKFAPFQRSSARRPSTPHRSAMTTPKVIPFPLA